jgi:hypothetical protein
MSAFDRWEVSAGDMIEAVRDGFFVDARIELDLDKGIDDNSIHSLDPEVNRHLTEQQWERLREARKLYFQGSWCYCGVVLSVSRAGVMLSSNAASLWGLEMNYPRFPNRYNPAVLNTPNDYLTEVANELLPEALEVGRAALVRLGVPVVSSPVVKAAGVSPRRNIIRRKSS